MGIFKNLKIGKKLILAFVIVALLASASSVITTFLLHISDTKYSDALTNYGFSQGDIGKTMVTLSEANRAARDIINSIDADTLKKSNDDLASNLTKYNTYLRNLESSLIEPQEQKYLSNIEEYFSKYEPKLNEITALGNTTDEVRSRQAQQKCTLELDPLYDQLYNELSALMNYKINTGTELSTDLTKMTSAIMVFNFSLIVAVFIISILLGLLIAKSISKPINICVDRLEKLAQGDLTSRIPDINSKDESGVLAKTTKSIVEDLAAIIEDIDYQLGEMSNGNFNILSKEEKRYSGDFKSILTAVSKINDNLSSTLSMINQSADQVATGSEQVSTGAQSLSQGATEQAASVQELVSTIESISSQVTENAENAEQASEKANYFGNEIQSSNTKMNEMLNAMKDISVSSQEIGKIIKTIEDIAFQTNILALNAAVEAARAGEAGKGFSVVADEVRNLASKSAEASKNTAELISTSLKAVENGTKIADDTAKSLDSAVAGSKDVMDLVGKISSASSNQSESISQVAEGINQISAVVQTNSATAEESAATSEELSGQAQMLKGYVNKFILKNGASSINSSFAAVNTNSNSNYSSDSISFSANDFMPDSLVYKSNDSDDYKSEKQIELYSSGDSKY